MFRDMSTALTGVLRSRAEAVNRMQSDPQDGDICISDDSDSSEEVSCLFTGRFSSNISCLIKQKNTAVDYQQYFTAFAHMRAITGFFR